MENLDSITTKSKKLLANGSSDRILSMDYQCVQKNIVYDSRTFRIVYFRQFYLNFEFFHSFWRDWKSLRERESHMTTVGDLSDGRSSYLFSLTMRIQCGSNHSMD